MRLIIADTPDDVASWTAAYVAKRIRAFKPTPEKPFVLGLPTGSSPVMTYRKLVAMHKAGEISFANVVTFNMGARGRRPRDGRCVGERPTTAIHDLSPACRSLGATGTPLRGNAPSMLSTTLV
jgi:hypothetical protein